MMENRSQSQCTLYVGNLPTPAEMPNNGILVTPIEAAETVKELLKKIFCKIGPVKSTKMIHDPEGQAPPYCFVEFECHNHALAAKNTMDGRSIFGSKNIKVNWASSETPLPHGGPRLTEEPVSGEQYHIYVGDISEEVDDTMLKAAFRPFGQVLSCRIVREPNSTRSKGYGFISFPSHDEAQNAVHNMRGEHIGTQRIKTGWASRKPVSGGAYKSDGFRHRTIAEVKAQTAQYPNNCTVYMGNLPTDTTDAELREMLSNSGQIQEMRLLRDKGYAFIKMCTHESAASVISEQHGQPFKGSMLKCGWGKDESIMNQLGHKFVGYGGVPGPTWERGNTGGNEVFPSSSEEQQSNANMMEQWYQYYSQWYDYNTLMNCWGAGEVGGFKQESGAIDPKSSQIESSMMGNQYFAAGDNKKSVDRNFAAGSDGTEEYGMSQEWLGYGDRVPPDGSFPQTGVYDRGQHSGLKGGIIGGPDPNIMGSSRDNDERIGHQPNFRGEFGGQNSGYRDYNQEPAYRGGAHDSSYRGAGVQHFKDSNFVNDTSGDYDGYRNASGPGYHDNRRQGFDRGDKRGDTAGYWGGQF